MHFLVSVNEEHAANLVSGFQSITCLTLLTSSSVHVTFLVLVCIYFGFIWVWLLYNVVLVLPNNLNRPYVYIPPLPHEPPPPSSPIPPLQVITGTKASLPVLCSSFPPAVYPIPGSVHKPMLLSNSSLFFPTVSICPFSTSSSLFCPANSFI